MTALADGRAALSRADAALDALAAGVGGEEAERPSQSTTCVSASFVTRCTFGPRVDEGRSIRASSSAPHERVFARVAGGEQKVACHALTLRFLRSTLCDVPAGGDPERQGGGCRLAGRFCESKTSICANCPRPRSASDTSCPCDRGDACERQAPGTLRRELVLLLHRGGVGRAATRRSCDRPRFGWTSPVLQVRWVMVDRSAIVDKCLT